MDWLIKQTGRYQNYAYDAKTFPPEVKSYKMIPRVMERYGRHREGMARAAEAAGHVETAAELYFLASEKYRLAQHAIYEDDNKEKIYLHGKQLECYLKAAAYAPNPVELVEIPFEDNYIQGFLHLVPGGKKAPTVVFAPGMDMTKESTINPLHHPFIVRGMNFLSLDGPGKGTSNIRKMHVTADNYCKVGTAAIDFLSQRPEVDMDKIAVSGYSFGSYWGMQMAAADKRVKAIATAAACYGPMTSIFEEETPHFKQVFMYMAGIEDEAQFDEMANQMSLDGIAGDVTCPCLIISGEYDPLAPLDTVLDSIDLAVRMGLPVKINCVPMRSHNLSDLVGLAALAKERPLSVRFIEMMPIGLGRNFGTVGTEFVLRRLSAAFGQPSPACRTDGNGDRKSVV